MSNKFVDAAAAQALQQELIGELMRIAKGTVSRADIPALVAARDQNEIHALLMRAVDETTALFDAPLEQFKQRLAALPRACAEPNDGAPR